MKNYLRKIKNNSAFTLIEVMVSISVVIVGMMGVVSLMTQNITVQSVNKNNLIASMLAQEGLELVRQVRDSNWIRHSSTVNFADGINQIFVIDPVNGIQEQSGLSIDNALANIKIDANGFYQHSGASSTIFSRIIEATSTDPSVYLRIKSTVRWIKNEKNYDYVAETLLYDWQ